MEKCQSGLNHHDRNTLGTGSVQRWAGDISRTPTISLAVYRAETTLTTAGHRYCTQYAGCKSVYLQQLIAVYVSITVVSSLYTYRNQYSGCVSFHVLTVVYVIRINIFQQLCHKPKKELSETATASITVHQCKSGSKQRLWSLQSLVVFL